MNYFCSRLLFLVVLVSVSGCAGMRESIQQRIEISEQCRIATAIKPTSVGDNLHIASIFLGNVGYCDVGGKETLLPICSFNQIKKSYVAPTLGGRADFDSLKGIEEAAEELRISLVRLQALLAEANKTYHLAVKEFGTANFKGRSRALDLESQTLVAIANELAVTRTKLAVLREKIAKLNAVLDQQARIELAAWESNLRAHLAQFEQLLAGDYNVVWRAGLRDQVLTHVARRSLEFLHGSLKPADTILNKLDDKAYGALSIGYLAFGNQLQESVKVAYSNVRETFGKRIGLEKVSAKNKEDIAPFFVELRRAACDNLLESTQFSMLTELVDTMLITEITSEFKLPDQLVDEGQKSTAKTAPQPVNAATQQSSNMTVGETGSGSTVAPPVPPSPLAVYATNQWAARQQLLTKKIAARLSGNEEAGVKAFPAMESVDESAVRRLADAATAKSVDDATYVFPSLLTNDAFNPNTFSAAMSSGVKMSTATAAVNLASLVLTTNVTVSNNNEFNPTNYNNIAPVINIPPMANSKAIGSLCSLWDHDSVGASCTAEGQDYVITFPKRSYREDDCMRGDIAQTLDAVGRHLALYRERTGMSFRATIGGYASQKPARLAFCAPASKPDANSCRYANLLHEPIDVRGCQDKRTDDDRNWLLSAARAKDAALRIERAASGAVIVRDLIANGAGRAGLRGELPSQEHDQTVVIHLQPIQ